MIFFDVVTAENEAPAAPPVDETVDETVSANADVVAPQPEDKVSADDG